MVEIARNLRPPLLFSTLGGFSPAVNALLKALVELRQNKLSKTEYEDTTWVARTWLVLRITAGNYSFPSVTLSTHGPHGPHGPLTALTAHSRPKGK